jgi:hypothetical protein
MKIEPGSKLLFIGDSITSGGRNLNLPLEEYISTLRRRPHAGRQDLV